MKAQSEKGFTLVEVLVSAAILGVGVMGMAAMQGMAFTKNVDANDLSLVTNIASDMMERIQANRQYAWGYHNLQALGPGNCAALPAPPPIDVTTPASINVVRVIQGDCTQWLNLVQASNLINVQGLVQVTNGVPANPSLGARQVVVQVQWNDRGAGQRLRMVRLQTTLVAE
ncbi:MAG: type IV pilus modification protein PilV [Nitrospira sp. LK70]|nr:type IV pilus modification protein PilV [Nitrospira sp. LK70]